MIIASPGIKVAVRCDCDGMTFSSTYLAEAYSSGSGWSQGDFRIACRGALHWAHAPTFSPTRGEIQIIGDWFAEIVGYGRIVDKPAIEQVAFTGRILWSFYAVPIRYRFCRGGASGIAEGEGVRCGGACLDLIAGNPSGGVGRVRRGSEGGGRLRGIRWGGCGQRRGGNRRNRSCYCFCRLGGDVRSIDGLSLGYVRSLTTPPPPRYFHVWSA